MKNVFLLLLLGFLFFSPFFVFAQGGGESGCPTIPDEPECRPVEYDCDFAAVARCESFECGGSFVSATKYFRCRDSYRTVPVFGKFEGKDCQMGWGCETLENHKRIDGPFYTPSIATECGGFQACIEGPDDVDGGGWKTSAACQCQGKCYPAPEVKALDDSTLFPKNVFDDLAKLKLPINIGIKDNVEKKLAETKNPDGSMCQVQSYEYEFTGGPKTVAGETPPTKRENFIEQCALAPAVEEYGFATQACANGSCGEKSEPLNFSTSSAPEPKSPLDPDWEGKEKSALPKIPALLEWCEAPAAKNYYYQIYKGEPEEKNLLWEDIVPFSTTSYQDEEGKILQKDVLYAWKVASCIGGSVENCGIFGQLWTLIPGEYELQAPTLLKPLFSPANPGNVPAINFSHALEWRGDPFIPFYLLDIGNGKVKKFIKNFANPTSVSSSSLWNSLQFNTVYPWKVSSCAKEKEADCEAASPEWKFQTTGAPPADMAEEPKEAGQTAIPANLSWRKMPGAASFVYEVAFDDTFSSKVVANQTLPESKCEGERCRVAVSNLKQDTTYYWRVKTCADTQGAACGNWSMRSFTTVKLTAPVVAAPKQEKAETIPYAAVSWNPVFSGNFYQYQVVYASISSPLLEKPEQSPDCKVGATTLGGPVAETSARAVLRCMGEYQVQVRACIDVQCKEVGEWSAPQTFTMKEPLVDAGGLVACDRAKDNPDTRGYDERQPCELKHIFLLIRNLIDFALWKLSLIVVVLMTILTAVTMFTSFGGPDVLMKIKQIWKAVGVGVLILLFSWILLNLLLGIVGFNINVFGRWYEIKL